MSDNRMNLGPGARCVDVHADTLEAFLCFQRTAFTLSLKGFLQSGDSNDNPGCSLSSGTLTQAIRNFAKSLEGWLTNAMTSFPQEIIRTKVSAEVFVRLSACMHMIYVSYKTQQLSK